MYGVYTVTSAEGNDDAQGIWIPFIVLGLFWWKRKELLSLPLKPWWPGLVLIALALALHVIGYVIQQPRASILALFAGLYGLTGLVWGRQWLRASLFPFFLFIFCIPFSAIATSVTFPLQLLVSRSAEFVANNVFGIDVKRVGTQLMDPMGQYQYEVAAACSGIRSLFTVGLMATIGAFLFYKSWWRRILLMASAVPLAITGNILRLLAIVVSAAIGGQKYGDYVHEGGPLGIISLLPYVPAFFGLLAAGKWLAERKASEPKPV
jgi:exosortase